MNNNDKKDKNSYLSDLKLKKEKIGKTRKK